MEKFTESLAKIRDIDMSALSNTDLLSLFISSSSLAVAIFSFIIAMIALIYTGYQFYLKNGTRFEGTYSLTSSVWSQQHYISNVLIENKKDKAAAINYIYLRIGSNIYVELINYTSSPRIILPFETIKIDLSEGVSGYISSTYKVDLNPLLGDRKKRKTLIVATPQGLSTVKRYKTYWNVHIESLKNHFITSVHPVRKYYKGKEYSDSLEYVLTITRNGTTDDYFLYRGGIYTINNLEIKTNDFSSTHELEYLLKNTTTNTADIITSIKVGYNYREFSSYEQVEIHHSGIIETHIFGKILTKLSNWSFRIKQSLRRS
ncbi:hypothetical protein ACTACL_09490 [Pseudomonas syringae]|uniref:hypothetical protein n=1 Tax=Pseudomonas syringae TaxID=317 RepID=UPI003F7927AB